jgi:glucose-1-phosphate cytidylyltransferase
MSDMMFDIANNAMTVHERKAEPWKVTLVDKGDATLTGGRLARVAAQSRRRRILLHVWRQPHRHRHRVVDRLSQAAWRNATVTVVAPQGRYGALEVSGTKVTGFTEKPRGDGGRTNGAFSSCRRV